jgi:ABC-type transport system involved in multi-copper enzyme maturation permease subunit
MKLEMKKFKVGGYIKGACITSLVLLALIVGMNFMSRLEADLDIKSFIEEIVLIDVLVRNTFMVFAAVLLARVIIDEYKSNTITVLFMYPINRYKLFLAKIFLVVIFTFLVIVLSDIFICGAFYIINIFARFVPTVLEANSIFIEINKIIIKAIATSFISLIPLFVGMRKKSVPATIVSSIILVSIVGSNSGGVSISDILWVQIILSAIGIFVAYLGIRNIEKRDVA